MTMRKTVVIGFVLTAALALGGCSMSRTGHPETSSKDKVASQIRALPNVTDATVGYEQTMDGLSKHYAIAVDISAPKAGGSKAEVSALIDKVLPLAWSVRGEEPDRGVILRIKTDPQLEIGPIATASGWRDVGYPKNAKLLAKIPYQATFGYQSLNDQIGPWPVRGDGKSQE